jgi:MFS family permease
MDRQLWITLSFGEALIDRFIKFPYTPPALEKAEGFHLMGLREKYFYGYNIVAAGFIVQGAFIGAMFTYGVFFNELQAEFGWSRAMIAGASSLAFLVMGLAGVMAGRMNDWIGPRIIIVLGGISAGIGYLLMSWLQTSWQLYLFYGVLVGIGFSTHEVITLSTVARWFVKRRGTMSGIVKVGTGCGQLLGPLGATALIAAYGWREAYLFITGGLLVTLLAVAQVMRRDPQDMGVFPDGDSEPAANPGAGQAQQGVSLRNAVRRAQFWTMCLAECAIFFCLLTMIVHIVPHATDLGLGPVPAAGVLSTMGGASILGRIVMGIVNDRIGGKRSLYVCFVALIFSLVWLLVAVKGWMLFVFAVIYGFAHGGFFTVMSPMVAELFGTGSHGLLFGMVLFCGTIGGALGPILAGAAFDATGSYQIVFIIFTLVAVGGLILTTRLRPLSEARDKS